MSDLGFLLTRPFGAFLRFFFCDALTELLDLFDTCLALLAKGEPLSVRGGEELIFFNRGEKKEE